MMRYFYFMLIAIAINVILVVSQPGKLSPPIYDCDEQNLNPKFYNESCKNDTECFGGPNSMVCLNNICQCAENNIPEERFAGEHSSQTVCVSAPYLWAPCKTTCQKPSVCKPFNDTASKTTVNICQCEKPYTFSRGSCYLECKKDEIYDQSKGKCIPKCKTSEIKINETCLPIAALGGKCQGDGQCQVAYSFCKSGSCSCRDGFSAKNGICVPQSVSCPSGDPLKKGKDYQLCRVFFEKIDCPECDATESPIAPPPPPPPPEKAAGGKGVPPPPPPPPSGFVPYPRRDLKDDCPKDYYCQIVGQSNTNENATGYCCPKEKKECPVGKEHPTAKCGGGEPGEEYCPWETHYCYGSVSGTNDKQLCCPKSCPSSASAVDGKCYAHVGLGEPCSVNEQCLDTNQDCIDGACRCSNGAKEISNGNYKYCSQECEPDEVLQNSKCYKQLKLGQDCSKQKWRCPTNGYCNKNNLCACQCPMFTLAENVCAPAPVCREPPPPFPLFGAEAKGGLAGAPPPPPPPPPPVQIKPEERDKLLKNVTFCTLKGKKPPTGIKAADKCPQNEYCSHYLNNLGLCCKRPEPRCPGGSKPTSDKKCDPEYPLSCGLSQICYQYLYFADQDNKDEGRVCCPSAFPIPLK